LWRSCIIPHTSCSLCSIGKIFSLQGKIDEAANFLEQALEIKKVRVDKTHSSLAETKHILGSIYIKNERYADAISLLNSALSSYNKTRDCELLSSDVLDLLGHAHAATGDMLGAISVYQQSLKIKRASLGPDHISCGNVLMEIGRLQVSNNDLEDSLRTFKEVKRLYKIHYKRDHLKNADMLVQVGSVQASRTNHDVALKCFMEALRIRRMLIQEEKSNEVSEILVHLGRVYQQLFDHKAAIQCFQQALGSSDKHDDTFVFTVRRLLGTSFVKNEDYYDAITCLEECLAFQENTSGCDSNNEWISIAYDLATAKIKFGDDAGTVLEKCIFLAKENGLIDERLANALFQYGNVISKDRPQKALCYFEEALAIKKDVGASPIELSEVLYEIGLMHETSKEYNLSIESYQESLTLRQSTNTEDELTADILFRLGEVYRMCGKLDLAYNSLTVALGAYYMAVGKNHTSVANTFHSLGYICGE
jgi:tetratricopeptide (TPR) repeat protein